MKKIFFIFWMLCAFVGKGQEARLVLPVGHSGVISAAIFSPNNKLACTISDKDETPIVWDVESGKMLYKLIGHEGQVSFVTFSHTGSMIYTQSAPINIIGRSADSTVRIWDANTGREILKIKSLNLDYHLRCNFNSSHVFSTDEKFTVIANDNNTQIFEISTGKMINSIEGNYGTAFFCPKKMSSTDSTDLILIVSSLKENIVSIWNASKNELLYALNEHKSKIMDANFSPDGKYIITVTYNTVRVWDSEDGKLLHKIEHTGYIDNATFSPDSKSIVSSTMNGNVCVWNILSGKKVLNLKEKSDGYPIFFAMSHNGKYLATAFDFFIEIYDIESGTRLKFFDQRRFLDEKIYGRFKNIKFSSDDKLLITGSDDKVSRVWDIESAKLLQTLKGFTTEIFHSKLSLDGKLAVSFGSKWRNFFSNPIIWNVNTGKFKFELNQPSKSINSLKFSDDNRYVLNCSAEDNTTIWDLESSTILSTIDASSADAIFSKDNKLVITVGLQSSSLNEKDKSKGYNATVWDLKSGKKLRIINKHKQEIYSVDISNDGKLILTSSADGKLIISDLNTGNEILQLNTDFEDNYNARLSPDAKSVVILKGKNYRGIHAEHWSIELEKKIHHLYGHKGNVNSAEFSSDGKFILTASEDNTARIWDATTGKELLVLRAHEGSVNTANFSSDGKYVLTTGNDNKSILWNANSGKIIYHHLQLRDGEWLAYDENYRYDGSEKARNLLYFVCGLEIVDLSQVKDALYVPNLVQRLMNGENLDHLPKLNDLEICGLTPEIEPIKNKNDGNYYSEISPGKGGTGQVEIYINGMLRQTVDSKTLTQKDGIFELKIDEKLIQQYQIADKETEIKVIARTADNKITSRGAVARTTAKETVYRKPSLHAIMVGIDDYKGEGLDLNYAAKDAIDLQTALKISTQKLFNVDDTNRVHFYNLTLDRGGNIKGLTPDRNNILKTLEKIEKESKPEDVFVLFFAGHGEINPEKQLILLTAEASKEQAPNYSGILMKELLEKLAKIPAGKRILLLDACHSGAAINELNIKDIAGVRDGEDAEKQSQRLKELENLASKSGLAIITASSTDQKALELPQYEHGLMTYALLTTMLNDPEVLDKDNNLQLEDWLRQTEKNVSKLIENQSAQRFVPVNFSLGKVDEEVRKSILLQEIPTIVVANVYNKELDDDNLDLKTQLIKKLNEISTRGGTDKILIVKEETPNAISVNLSYELIESKIKSKITLKKEKKVFKQFNFEGNSTDLNKFVEDLSKEITKNLK